MVIPIDQHAHLLRQLVLRLRHGVSDQPPLPGVVARRLRRHEVEPTGSCGCTHRSKRVEYVVRKESDVLDAFSLQTTINQSIDQPIHEVLVWPRIAQHYLVLLEIGLYLGLPLGAVGGLVDGQQDRLFIIRQHHAVQSAVHRAHILRCELGKLMEALAKKDEPS